MFVSPHSEEGSLGFPRLLAMPWITLRLRLACVSSSLGDTDGNKLNNEYIMWCQVSAMKTKRQRKDQWVDLNRETSRHLLE